MQLPLYLHSSLVANSNRSSTVTLADYKPEKMMKDYGTQVRAHHREYYNED